MAVLINEIIDAGLTVDGAKTGATFPLSWAQSLAVVVTASSSSTPSGTTIQLSVSCDGVNWVSLGTAVSVTGDGSFAIAAADCVRACDFYYGRILYARSGGSYVANTRIMTKGEAI